MSLFTLSSYLIPDTFSSIREIHYNTLQRTVSQFNDYNSLKEWILENHKAINLCKIEDFFKEKSSGGTARFEDLLMVAQLILSIPHSNAEEERLFSLIKRNKMAFRPSLDPEETLASILITKLAMKGEKLNRMELPDEILKKAKKATWEYNKAHSS